MPAKKKAKLVWEDGYWWLVTGDKKENLGRSRRYAEKLAAEKETNKK